MVKTGKDAEKTAKADERLKNAGEGPSKAAGT
jgi:hypothetical protein